MSGEGGGPGRVRQVWLPGAGIWAAVPDDGPLEQQAARKQRAASVSGGVASGPRKPPSERPVGQKRPRDSPEPHAHVPEAVAQVGMPQQEQAAPVPAAACGGGAAADAMGAAHQPAYTGFELQHSDPEASDVEEYEAPPTCPICLTDIIELADKAVVATCMHAFCHACISRWLDHKRFCPMCKARVISVMFDITASGTYKERTVPLSPKHPGSSGGGGGVDAAAEGGLPLLQRLQEFLGVAGLLDPYEQQQQRRQQRGQQQQQQYQLRQESGSGRIGYSSRERQGLGGSTAAAAAAGAGPSGSRQQQQQPAAGAPGPRPYFWRLQQRLQAGAYRPGGSDGSSGPGGWGALHSGGHEGAVSEEDYVLLWRRQVYDQDLWAVPLGAESARVSLGSGSARERRLTEWIDRELRALLQTDDVTIIRGFVMGLLVAYGVEPFTSSSSSGTGGSSSSSLAARQAAAAASRRAAEMVAAAGSSRGSSRRGGINGDHGSGSGSGGGGAPLSSNPVAALQPFLYDNSEHFWHELRCFATAVFNISTYDRMVQYQRREAAVPAAATAAAGAPLPAAPAGPGAPGRQQRRQQQQPGGRGRSSRWDQGRPAAAAAAAAATAPVAQAQAAQQRQRGQQQGQGSLLQPGRAALQASGSAGRQRVLQRQGACQQAADGGLPGGQHRLGSGGGSSRNPSPPPLPPLPAAPAGSPPQGQQEPAAGGSAERVADARSTGSSSRSRSRSRSRDEQQQRERRRRSRSSSRSDRRRQRRRQPRRSASRECGHQRRRPRQRRQADHSPSGLQGCSSHRRGGGYDGVANRLDSSRGRRHGSSERRYGARQRYSPEQYKSGADDGGDRWDMC